MEKLVQSIRGRQNNIVWLSNSNVIISVSHYMAPAKMYNYVDFFFKLVVDDSFSYLYYNEVRVRKCELHVKMGTITLFLTFYDE